MDRRSRVHYVFTSKYSIFSEFVKLAWNSQLGTQFGGLLRLEIG